MMRETDSTRNTRRTMAGFAAAACGATLLLSACLPPQTAAPPAAVPSRPAGPTRAAVKPTGPPPRAYVPKGAEETYVVQSVAAFTEAVNARATDRFMSRVSSGYYKGFSALEKTLKAGLTDRHGYYLNAVVTGVEYEDPKYTAAVAWNAKWVSKATGRTEEDSGETILIFVKGQGGLKLIDSAGDTILGF
jgi:hypothetical protein